MMDAIDLNGQRGGSFQDVRACRDWRAATFEKKVFVGE